MKFIPINLLNIYKTKTSLILSVFVLSLCGFNSAEAQGEKRIKGSIQHITVFRDRAQVDATAKTTVSAGTTQVVIERLASTIDPNSIQIGGKGDVVIMGVKFKQNYLSSNMATPIEDSLKMTKAEIETIKMLLKVAENEQKMLMANANIKNEKEGLLPEDLKEMVDFFRTKLTEIGTRTMQLERQLMELQERENKLAQQAASQSSTRNQPMGEIVVSVSAKTTTNLDLTMTYIVNNVGWYPSYDMRVKDSDSPVAFAYRANVYQNTGVDWDNVKLTLSTANPSQGGTKPELYPQFVSVYEPRPVLYAKNARQKDMMQSESMVMAAPMAMEVASGATITTMTESTLAVNFDIALPYTVKSGGVAEMVDIQNFSFPATYSYYSTPKLDKDGFLVATITDWEKYNLLPGKANVFFEGTFVGETEINGSETGDSLVISLGRDKKIITKREEIEAFKSRKNVGSNIKESFAYKISLRNTKNSAIKLTVEDQLPVSQDSRIEVELEEAKDAEFNKETGKITWTVSLNPAENKELILRYNVKYPKGKTVTNL